MGTLIIVMCRWAQEHRSLFKGKGNWAKYSSDHELVEGGGRFGIALPPLKLMYLEGFS